MTRGTGPSIQEVVLEFDFSSLWPKESHAAIKVFQGAFLLEMAETLREKLNVDAYVGDERFAQLSAAEAAMAKPFARRATVAKHCAGKL